ncbi:hypothetical protein HERIO_1336 [Hepatospora eriocheir]|uniref:TFIIE beta domain-containing protein n=1 Tax=Hepatospora eriocheir TaxID=1081669 RepID=A0A1X0QAC9_9MICR|nr:hypothetical protein HERIO_1336 [Hepatospora eriocheir]
MAHINIYIHKIIEFIKKSDKEFSFKEIELNCGVKVSAVYYALKNNPKVHLENEKISYCPEFGIKTREELKKVLIEKGEGISLERLDDGPFNVSSLLFTPEEMKERSKKIDRTVRKRIKSDDKPKTKIDEDFIILRDLDGSEMVFYYDNKYKLPVNEETKQIWASIEIPEYYDVLEELSKKGLKTEKIETTKKQKPKIKKKKNRRKINLTNTHVQELEKIDFNEESD